MQNYLGKFACEKCDVRIPKNRPLLICDLCENIKHYKCQNLSKKDAIEIIFNSNISWTCHECTMSILPLNICDNRQYKSLNTKPTSAVCRACEKRITVRSKTSNCNWCDERCHDKCISVIGCKRCRMEMIPGCSYNCSEINGNFCLTKFNDKFFDPFSRDRDNNNIGEKHSLENESVNG